jgi:Flp pilus assembly protein TadD
VAYENMGLLPMTHGSIADAKNFLKKANRIFPNNAKLWHFRVIVEHKSGDFANAEKAAKEDYSLDPDTENNSNYSTLFNIHQN